MKSFGNLTAAERLLACLEALQLERDHFFQESRPQPVSHAVSGEPQSTLGEATTEESNQPCAEFARSRTILCLKLDYVPNDCNNCCFFHPGGLSSQVVIRSRP